MARRRRGGTRARACPTPEGVSRRPRSRVRLGSFECPGGGAEVCASVWTTGWYSCSDWPSLSRRARVPDGACQSKREREPLERGCAREVRKNAKKCRRCLVAPAVTH